MVRNLPTEATQVSTVVKVAMDAPSVLANIFTGILKGILGFTITQVSVFVVNRYDIEDSVLYWKFTDIE